MNKIVLLLSVISVIGCAPEFYSPNRVKIPELKQKKDVRLSCATGYLEFEAQIAYALTNNIGLIIKLCKLCRSSTDETGFDGGGGGGIEFGGRVFFLEGKCNI